jgi:tetratricopeptide (TPR) repeat protein
LLHPAIAGRLTGVLGRLEARFIGWWLVVIAGLWLLNDRSHWIGDWLMREGSTRFDTPLGLMYPQALPLDLAIHVHLPRAMSSWIDGAALTRILGACEATVLVLVATSFAKSSSFEGSVAAAAVGMTLLAGTVDLFSGFNKAATEMCVMTAALALSGVRSVKRGTSPMLASFVVALSLCLHRLGIVLLPALAVVLVLWWRSHRANRPHAWLEAATAVALPLVTLGFVGRDLYRTFVSFDLPRHVLTGQAPHVSDVLKHAFSAGHLLDLLNVLVVLAPAAMASLALAFLAPQAGSRRESFVLVALALPFIALFLLIPPQQGVFRDLDVFAPGCVALTFLLAHRVGETLRANPGSRWLAVPLTGFALTSSLAWFGLHHAESHAREWIRSFAVDAPRRSSQEIGLTWDYLGYRAMSRDDWKEAAEDWSEAAARIPSPRILTLSGMAATMIGDLSRARELFQRAVDRDSDMVLAWRGLASTSFRLGNDEGAREAVNRLQSLGADPPELSDLLSELRRREGPRRSEYRQRSPNVTRQFSSRRVEGSRQPSSALRRSRCQRPPAGGPIIWEHVHRPRRSRPS